MLKWRTTGKHEIFVQGIVKPSELRRLLEFGLRHIRACMHRGIPVSSVSQVSQQKYHERQTIERVDL